MTSLAAKEPPTTIDLTHPGQGLAGSGGKPWIFLVKIGVSLGLIGLLVFNVDTGLILGILRNITIWPLIAAVLVFSVQCGLAGMRCRVVVGKNWPVSISAHVRFFWIGQFFNQLLPSTIGGDVIRAWLLSRQGPPLPTAIKLTVIDRLIGVIALMLVMVFLASWPPALASLESDIGRMLGLMAAGCLAALLLVLILLRWKALSDFIGRFRLTRPVIALLDEFARLMSAPSRAAKAFGLALLVHVCSISAFWFSAKAIGEPLGITEAALIVPPMLLIAMMPISVAGWGVREGVVLIGLGFQGISAEAAISIALLFGLALLVASLPGSLLWMARRPSRGERRAKGTDHG